MEKSYYNQQFFLEQDLQQPYIYLVPQKEQDFVIYTSNSSFLALEKEEDGKLE